MEAFATVDDLKSRWRTIADEEKPIAESLLLDASIILAREFERAGKSLDDTDELTLSALKMVCCAMVKRVMAVSDDAIGITQIGTTAGSFSQQRTYSQQAGDLYLRDLERNLLGIPKRRVRIGSLRPKGAFDDEG